MNPSEETPPTLPFLEQPEGTEPREPSGQAEEIGKIPSTRAPLKGGMEQRQEGRAEPEQAPTLQPPAGMVPAADRLSHGNPTLSAVGEAQILSSVAPGEPASPTAGVPSIPGYEVLGELGHGGMGVVYKARHLGLKRLVALKVIRSGACASAREVKRFRAEAEAVARLNHPNIVTIHEVGEFSGQPYFSLEYIEGGSLDRRVKNTPQSPRDSARLVRTLALAMQVPHQASPPIVHRDLKPANVLLRRKSESLPPKAPVKTEAPDADDDLPIAAFEPKVTDFGLAKELDSSSDSISTAIVGTPEFMAPEQAEGRNADIDVRTDVYALGAILYQMLTGRPPFKGASVMDTLELVRSNEPLPPTRMQPKVPRDLETICLKCLHKNPERRYQSARALADDLQRYLDNKPILGRPVSTWERTLRWARRRPAQAALLVALLLIVLAGVAGALFYGRYQKLQATVLTQSLQRRRQVDDLAARGQSAEAAGQHKEARQYYDQALSALNAEPDSADEDLRERIAQGQERTGRKLKEQMDQEKLLAQRQDFRGRVARFERHGDQVLFHAVNLREEEAAANAAVVRRESPVALDELGLTPSGDLRRWRQLAESPGEIDRLAMECYRILLVWAEAESKKNPQQAQRLRNAATALQKEHGFVVAGSALDTFAKALADFRRGRIKQAAAGCEETLRKQPEHFWAQYLKALCDVREGEWKAAKVGLLACLGRRPAAPASFLAICGLAHGQLREFVSAEDAFKRALGGASDPATRAYVLTNRGVVRILAGQWEDAQKDLLEVVKLQPSAYQGHLNLAQAYEGHGDLDKALQSLNRALELQKDSVLYYTRARLYARRKDPAAARRDFQEVIDREPQAQSERRASALVELAHLKHQAREYPAALADCVAALRAQPDYAPAYRERAMTRLALGRFAAAGRDLDRCLERGKPSAVVYQARGLVHYELGEFPEAVGAFTISLRLKPDAKMPSDRAKTLSYRGWAYLGLKSPQLALPDFEAALALGKENGDALCGRGLARVQLSYPPEKTTAEMVKAMTDAEAALRHGKPTAMLLLNCGRIYARIVGRLQGAETRHKADHSRHRALELLAEALETVPPAERVSFWRQHVKEDAALRPLKNTERMLMLARTHAR